MANKPFEIQSPTLSINGLAIDTSANAKLVIPGVTRAGTSVAIEVNDTGDQTHSWAHDGDPATVVIIDGYQFAVLAGDPGVTSGGQVGWTAATYAADALDGEGYIDGISVVSGGTGYTGEAAAYSQTMYATSGLIPVYSTGNEGVLDSSTYYLFPGSLVGTNLIGAEVYIAGMPSGVTVADQNDAINGGTNTGLRFSQQFQVGIDDWSFLPAGYDPLANFVIGDWFEIPFKVRCGAGNIESEFGGGSGSGLVQRTVNFPQGESGDTAGTMALDPSGNVYVCTADWADANQSYEVDTAENYNSGQDTQRHTLLIIPPSAYPNLVSLVDVNTPSDWTITGEFDLQAGGTVSNTWAVTAITAWVPTEGDFIGESCWAFDVGVLDQSFVVVQAGTTITLNFVGAQPAIWEQLSTGSGGSSISNNGETLSIRSDGEVVLDGPEGGVNRGVRWNYGSQNSGVDSFVRQDDNGFTIQSYADGPNPNGTNIILRTGDTSNTWTFQPDGGLTFPDGSTQTTAYTGSGGGFSSSELYIMANVDGTIITSTDGINWSQPQASGVPTESSMGVPFPVAIGKLDIHNGVIVYTRADAGIDSFPGLTGLYYSTEIGTAILCQGTDTLLGDDLRWNEVHYFTEASIWVAVGWANGSYEYPVHAYSTNGIDWTVLTLDSTFASNYNGNNSNWHFTDVAYNTNEGVFVIVGTMENGFSGAFVTDNITAQLNVTNFVSAELNARYIASVNVVPYGGPSGYMMVIPDGQVAGFWNTYSPVSNPSNWYDDTGGQYAWYQTAMIDAVGYVPDIAEITSYGTEFIVTTNDGQIAYFVPAPFLPVAVPLPYTTTNFTISNANPAVITFIDNSSISNNEKIVITNSTNYDGTYYINTADGTMWTNQAMNAAYDTTSLAPFVSGTVTFSHGQFIDAAGQANGVLYVGNDDEQVFRSTDGGSTWTLMDDGMDYGAYFNDFAYGTYNTAISRAELIGDGATSGNGYQYTIYTDIDGYQGGESNGLIVAESNVGPYTVGDTITFRNGEVRTITNVNDWDPGVKWIQWNGSVDGNNDNPRLPFTVTSANYELGTKNTARIKPDETLAGIGQFMDVYTGAAPVMDDTGHIHMKGHSGNVELFLGTDNNYVSSKEAGSTPAGVKLKSQTDVRVVDSELRMYRNGTWVSIYGDGRNRNIQNNTHDLAHSNVATDALGNIYVGGEHCYNEDAYISKYDRDGNLIWNKYNNSNDIYAQGIYGIATHGDEVGIIVRTGQDRNYNYCKLTVLDSATGNVKTITDVYNDANSVYATDLIYHSTLGWVIAGYTNSDVLTTAELTANGATGQNIIEFTAADTIISGQYPSYSNAWSVYGTNIGSPQVLNNDGVGLWQSHPTTTVTGTGQDAYVNVRVDYNQQTYNLVYPWPAGGSGYADRDIIRIPGSQLNGIDNVPVSGLSGFLPESGSSATVLYILKSNFPTLDADVHVNDFVRDGVNQYFRVTDVPYTNPDDSSMWLVPIYPLNDAIGSTVGLLTFTRGNDLVMCVSQDGGGIVTGTISYFGTAARTVVRLDMGWMGYNNDFTGGTFTFQLAVDQRPWLWSNSWDRFLEPPIPTNPTDYHGDGWLRSVTEDVYDGGVVASGYMFNQTSSGSLIWKLDASGNTVWAKSIDADDNDVNSLAVSPTTGAIYGATRWTAIFKLSSTGDLITRKEVDTASLNDAFVYLERDDNGNEIVYAGGRGYSYAISASTGVMVTKFDNNLNPQWTRELRSQYNNIYVNYGTNLRNTVIGNGQITTVGYGYIPSGNNYNALIYTISLGDDFENYEDNYWIAKQVAVRYVEYNRSMYNLLAHGSTGQASETNSDFGNDVSWTKWTFQLRRQDLNTKKHGITGVGVIEFSDGGTLDHNPVDIPPSLGDFQNSWNYTLRLSDRGRFIMNQTEPNSSDCNNLYIYVPLNEDVPFPVGSVITLINSNDANTGGGYEIFVYPENYNSNNCPKIYASGYSYNSQWSFPGMQTATLMKISTNAWLLTANNVVNRD